MSRILNIETATEVCSVSITEGKRVIAIREKLEGRSHAISLAVFIDELLKETDLKPGDLDAVAVSKGPGSYTGLRIGVSTAKGICYGANIPLISINTLESMCAGLLKNDSPTDNPLLIPMIDARRMEVYTAIFSAEGKVVHETHALIVEENSFDELANSNSLILFGDGADKLEGKLAHPNIQIRKNFKLSSSYMADLAHLKLTKGEFEDVAYFEPYYLKDFITTISKKKFF